MVKVVQPGNWNYFIGAMKESAVENAPADNWSDINSRSLARQFVTLYLVTYYIHIDMNTWQKLLTGSHIWLTHCVDNAS
jgi:hypothetical protein